MLASLDVSPEQRGRVFSPAGLDLGARTPGEIAVSIFAQLVQERAGRGHSLVTEVAAEECEDAAEATALDPVCGMTVAGLPTSLQVEHDGTSVYFCSAGCRRAFLAHPDQYATAR